MNFLGTIVEDFYALAHESVTEAKSKGYRDPTTQNHTFRYNAQTNDGSGINNNNTRSIKTKTVPSNSDQYVDKLFYGYHSSRVGKWIHFSNTYWKKKWNWFQRNPKQESLERVKQQKKDREHRIQNEHRDYSHLSIWSSTLKVIGDEISAPMSDFFHWHLNLIYSTSLVGFLGFIWQVWQNINLSVDYHLNFFTQLVFSRNPLLWLSITYMDGKIQYYWLFFYCSVIVVSLLLKWMMVTFSEMEQHQLLSQLDNVYEQKTRPTARPRHINHDDILNSAYTQEPHVQKITLMSRAARGNETELERRMENVQLEQDIMERDQFIQKRIRGYVFSIGTFLTLLVLQFLFTYYFFVLHDYSYDLSIGSVLVAVMLIINWFWKLVAQYLTELECHTDWESFYVSLMIKNFVFRYSSFIITFQVSQFQAFLSSSVPSTDSTDLFGASSLPETDCRFVILTEQFLFLMLSELGQTILFCVLIPVIYNRFILPRRNQQSNNSDNDMKLEFVFTTKLFDLLFKEFIVVMGSSVFPMMATGMAICLMIEYYCSLYALFHSKPILLTEARFLRLFFVLSVIQTIIAVAMPPIGGIFIIIGYERNCQLLL